VNEVAEVIEVVDAVELVDVCFGACGGLGLPDGGVGSLEGAGGGVIPPGPTAGVDGVEV
jgi:hypothetical protein